MTTKTIRLLLASLSMAALLSACATPANYYDPFEPVNRITYTFNNKLDRYAIKPVAETYADYVPRPAQQGVSNFVGNIGDVSSIIGNAMEGEFKNAAKDVARVFINTVFGMFGLVDWASDMGLEKQNRGIGKALGRWGIGTGPYLVLPFLGSTTVRDSTDPIFNWTLGVPSHFNTATGEYSYLLIGGISTRAAWLPYEEALDAQLIFDQYAYIRDSYLQKRYHDVYRGNPPKPFEFGEPDTTENDTKNDLAEVSEAISDNRTASHPAEKTHSSEPAF